MEQDDPPGSQAGRVALAPAPMSADAMPLAHLFGMKSDSEPNGWGLEPLLSIRDLAEHLGVPVDTIYDWRTRGLGPRAYRFGKHLKFARSDVQRWVEQHHEPESF